MPTSRKDKKKKKHVGQDANALAALQQIKLKHKRRSNQKTKHEKTMPAITLKMISYFTG